MTSISKSPQIELLRRCFDAWSERDYKRLEHALASDARWLPAVPDAEACQGRATIIEVMSRNSAGRPRGEIAEMTQCGSRVLVGFRPAAHATPQERPLDQGIAYLVVTLGDDQITELKGCRDRASALQYAEG